MFILIKYLILLNRHWFLALPVLPCLLGSILLLVLFPESPKALVQSNQDEIAARLSLQIFRMRQNVDAELCDILRECHVEAREGDNTSTARTTTAIYTLNRIFSEYELRWSLVLALLMNFAQQMSGINAVFYYSTEIFKRAGIHEENIQFAILGTGLVNLATTLACSQLIDRVGRRPLLLGSLTFICVDFMALCGFLTNKVSSFLQYTIIIIRYFIEFFF